MEIQLYFNSILNPNRCNHSKKISQNSISSEIHHYFFKLYIIFKCLEVAIVKNLPIHGRIIHESSITLQVKLAERQNTQGNKGNREDQTQKRIRSAAAFSNTRKRRVGKY